MLEQNEQKRTARLEARLTPAVFALVQRAAGMQGRSVSDFVVSAAQQAAEAAIEQRERIELSHADQQRFVAALLDPSPPTPAMQKAAEHHQQVVEPS